MHKHPVSHWFNHIKREYYRNTPLFVMRATILLLLATLFISKRNFWTPDTLFIVMLAVAVAFGQTRAFLIRFLPLVTLLLAYDSFRGIADDLNKNVHYFEMIHFDRWLFGGTLPTVTLQNWWWNGSLSWFDFALYFLYTMHFVAPVLLAVLIWKVRDKLYWQYMWALIGLSFAAFITYVIYPAAPPWLAAEQGYIEPIQHMSSHIWFAMGVTNYSEVYASLSPNLVAAIPSLHSAYPLLFTMFLIKLFGWRRAWWTAAYPMLIWIGVVYLGEHYVIDAILGAAYAVAAYYASAHFFARYNQPSHTIRRFFSKIAARLPQTSRD